MKKTKKIDALITLIITASGSLLFANPRSLPPQPANPGFVKVHSRTVKVSVGKDGFSPSRIDAEMGHKLNLVFNRAVKQACGSSVSIPKLNVRKSLPVNTDVIISFTPDKEGQINYICGSKRGTIFVTD